MFKLIKQFFCMHKFCNYLLLAEGSLMSFAEVHGKRVWLKYCEKCGKIN